MILLPLLLSLGLLLPFVNALKGQNGCGPYLCFNATVHGNMVTYEITPVFRRQPGWVALGFGKHMKGSHMVILWDNDDGSTTLSQRYATGHIEPKVVARPPRIAHLAAVTSTSWQPPNTTTYAFQIPLNETHHLPGSKDTAEDLIWALGLVRPQSRLPYATLSQHFRAGSLKIDLTKDLPDTDEELPTTTSSVISPTEVAQVPHTDVPHNIDISPSNPFTSHEMLVAAHGILVSLGFLVFLPMGSLVARWSRTFTPKWFKVHQIFNFYISLPVIVIGWLLGPIAVIDAQASHFLDAHQICGFVMLFLYLSQVYLGRYIHARRSRPKKTAHPPSNILHAGFGTLLIVLAFFQVRSGMNEWENATGRVTSRVLYTLWNAWAVIIGVTYLLGLSLLRRQFFQERFGLAPEMPADYVALSASPTTGSSNLVFNADADNVGVYGDAEGTFEAEKDEDIVSVPLLHKR